MRTRRGLARLIVALAIAAVACEVLVRALGRTDADGQFRIAGIDLPPLRPPLGAIADSVARYRAASDSFLEYDPDLGWAPRPGARTRDGLARVDASGARSSDTESVPQPAGASAERPPAAADDGDGARRAAAIVELFGDSFTFGDEVAFDDTWGAALARALTGRGLDVAVLNFGVNAYGIDQAYLRWRKVGRALHPAVVVLGLQPENVLRDLNVFRPLYFGSTEIPLSKPRFVRDGDALRLVNSPTLPPERVVETIASLPDHPLGAHEAFFDAHRASSRWWLGSRFLALLAAVRDLASTSGDDPYVALTRDRDAFGLAERLVHRFAAEVEADGAAFLVVYLPRREELARVAAGETSWDAPLRAALAASGRWIDPSTAFLPLADGDFRPAGHYGARLNAIVARELSLPVAERLRDRAAAR